MKRLIVGVDTGGTFTDVVYDDGRGRGSYKTLSTPSDPGQAVLTALAALFGSRPPDLVTYGTTVATNAMLQRRGVRAALVTTAGFEDVIEIGRQARPELYDLEPKKHVPLIPRSLRCGVAERCLYDGVIEKRLSANELRHLRRKLERLSVESVAVCLLHAHVNPEHERAIAEALAPLGIPVTTSHELSPEPGEYERTSTVAANAYVRPLVAEHLRELVRRSGARTFRVMQSNGGAIGFETACREPIRTMLSGPAGGVAAAAARARNLDLARIITFDMGGTSTDVALVDTAVPRRSITSIDGLPIRTPCIDIHTVGAGGGSIAELDPGGSLKVGPESAGADPGPACYGRGRRPTVTDANVVLGRLRAEAFLGGAMALDEAAARRAVSTLAEPMGCGLETAAEGIVRVVEGAMERAIRVITVERGQDPRSCTLVAYGGAAGLHACGLAECLGVRRILIPPGPGLLSAWGVMEGPLIRDRSMALRLVNPSAARLSAIAHRLEREVREEICREGLARSDVRTEAHIRMRYLGQSLVLEVPLSQRFRGEYDRAHKRLFHTSSPEKPIEVCGLRVTASGDPAIFRAPQRARSATPARDAAPGRVESAYLSGRRRRVRLYDREALQTGHRLRGPAIITEYSSTTLVAEGWRGEINPFGDLVLETRNA